MLLGSIAEADLSATIGLLFASPATDLEWARDE